MGEAKARADAKAAGRAWRMDLRCPVCRGREIDRAHERSMAGSDVKTDVAHCRSCNAIWEAYPADWAEDVVGALPCDNCVFRPGSPEIRDRAGWKELLATLKAGGDFRCHKGAPMHVDLATMTAEFDAAWIQKHGRTCAGFHRAVMTRPGWLSARYPELAAAYAELAAEDADG